MLKESTLMIRKNMVLNSMLGLSLFFGGMLFGQMPAENIDPHRHANLAAAQQHLRQAYAATDEAQKANKDELGGHAEKAKEHMMAADQELKQAAEFADHRK
jgi:ABC-type Zn uptake system ZnuABC Zn-binding protein ZnuA